MAATDPHYGPSLADQGPSPSGTSTGLSFTAVRVSICKYVCRCCKLYDGTVGLQRPSCFDSPSVIVASCRNGFIYNVSCCCARATEGKYQSEYKQLQCECLLVAGGCGVAGMASMHALQRDRTESSFKQCKELSLAGHTSQECPSEKSDLSDYSHMSGRSASTCLDMNFQAVMAPKNERLAKIFTESYANTLKHEKDRVMLGQMALQVQMKIARRCFPELGNDAYFARHMTLEDVKYVLAKTPEDRNRFFRPGKTHSGFVWPTPTKDQPESLDSYLEKYPQLEMGIELLETAGIVAFGWRQLLGDLKAITAECLQQLIDQEYGQSPLRGPVQQVLDCLIEVSRLLNEEVLVDYTIPSAHR